MRKNSPLLLSAVAVVLIGLAAILHFKAQRDKLTGIIPRKQTVTIAQAGDFYLYAPLYIAVDKGYFAAKGLDVSIVSTGGDEKTWAAVIAGSAQFGVADPTFVVIASQRGQPGRVISTVVNGVPFWGITKNPTIPVINKPSDLANYTVATFPSPSTAYTLQRRMFEMAGLAPKIRQGAFGTLLALTETGQADIALELEPNVSRAIGNGYRIVYSLSQVYGEFTMTGLTTTPEYIQSNPQIVAGIVEGLRESLDFLHQHTEESADLLGKRFPEIKRDVAVAALHRVLQAGIIPEKPIVIEGAWRKALQLRMDVGDVKRNTNPMEYIENRFTGQ
jgi:NitT/TauT family transport system substrate-binding protein